MGKVFVGLNHHLDFVVKVAMVTKKTHGAELSTAVQAAAGDALLSLSADVLSAAASHPSATLLLRVHVVIHYVKSTRLWWSTMSAIRGKRTNRRG